MSWPPCKNPNCNTPSGHPGCRCYSFAEGGSVGGHKPDCQYFAEGGKVRPPASTEAAIAHLGAVKLLRGGQNTGLDPQTFADASDKGSRKIASHVKDLFNSPDKYQHPDLSKHRDTLKKYLAAGGLGTQLAQGQSAPDPLAEAEPAHAFKLGVAKGDVYNYLNSLRPQPADKLPYDTSHTDPAAKRNFDRALDVANHPLGVLGHIQNGTIAPEHVKHLNSMYPELAAHLSQKLTEGVIKSQVDGKRPTHKVRQGLSLMLGASLDSTMTPAGISAAQATFSKADAKPQPASKSSPQKLEKLTESFQTGSQAAAARSQQTE